MRDWVQRRAIKMIRGLEHLYSEERSQKLWGDLIMTFQYLREAYRQEGAQLFTWFDNDKMRGNVFKLQDGRFILYFIIIFFFTQRLVRHWHSCPEKMWMPHPWRPSGPGWMGLWVA